MPHGYKNYVIKYCDKVHERPGKTLFWSMKKVLNKLMSRGFRASSLSLYVLSVLYTALPHQLIKEKQLIDQTENKQTLSKKE